MKKNKVLMGLMVLLLGLLFVGSSFGLSYQPAPPSGTYLASGISDVSGPGGLAYVEYWVWDGGDDY